MAEQRLYEELMGQLSAFGVVKRDIARNLPPDCPPGSAGVLTILSRHGDMRMSKLSEMLSVDISVTSRHVSHVAEHGWIERSPDPADRRSRILHLTPAGHDVLDRLSRRTTDLLADRLSDWSDNEVRDFTQLMAKLWDSFGDCRTAGHPSSSADTSAAPTPASARS